MVILGGGVVILGGRCGHTGGGVVILGRCGHTWEVWSYLGEVWSYLGEVWSYLGCVVILGGRCGHTWADISAYEGRHENPMNVSLLLR